MITATEHHCARLVTLEPRRRKLLRVRLPERLRMFAALADGTGAEAIQIDIHGSSEIEAARSTGSKNHSVAILFQPRDREYRVAVYNAGAQSLEFELTTLGLPGGRAARIEPARSST